MPTEPQPVTLAEVVRRAVDVCDPIGEDPKLARLFEQFEDSDEPVSAIQNLEERVAIAAEGADIEIEDPAVSMGEALILYLAHRRDELDGQPDELMRLAARAEWKGEPPQAVLDWLAERGVEV